MLSPIDATYINDEHEAFEALTTATRSARRVIRSTRYSPESVLTQPAYIKAIEARVLGTDGIAPLRRYERIIAVNSRRKIDDVKHHLSAFKERPFRIYLTYFPHIFELVVIDDSEVFIHFYKEEHIIASTLHLRGTIIAEEFERIFDRLKSRDLYRLFDCEEIADSNLEVAFHIVDEIFRERGLN